MQGIVRSFNPVGGGPAVWLEGPIREAAQVLRLLRSLWEFPGSEVVEIVINSDGGDTQRGLEMYTAVRECGRPTRATILDAGSMAGVFAMGCDTRRIIQTGSFHLHGSGYAASYLANERPTRHMPAVALRSLARACDATDAVLTMIFCRATGLDQAEVRRLMEGDTTLDAAEALRLGFVHEIVELRS